MKHSLFGIALGLAVAATTVQAQSMTPTAKPVDFGIAGGLSVPTGDLSNGVKSGFNVSALAEFKGAEWPVALRIEGQYQQFSGKGDFSDGKFKTMGGLANLLYYFPTKSTVSPYITGGVGFFHVKEDAGSACDPTLGPCSTTENKFGFDAGAGLKFQLTGFSTFIEADWQSIQTSGSAARSFPIRVGIKF